MYMSSNPTSPLGDRWFRGERQPTSQLPSNPFQYLYYYSIGRGFTPSYILPHGLGSAASRIAGGPVFDFQPIFHRFFGGPIFEPFLFASFALLGRPNIPLGRPLDENKQLWDPNRVPCLAPKLAP